MAIIMVMLFHAYARWVDLFPFGDKFARVIFFVNGWLGVQLFFMISGFVIIMTLDRCSRFSEFLLRRWFRLFPAMLTCSLLVFLTAPFFPERPAGLPSPRDLLPGLTFTDPAIWGKLLGGEQHVLEMSFWSLFVEVQFYIIFGILYFVLGRLSAIAGVLVIFLVSCLGLFHGLPYFGKMGPQHYGWFATGAMFYQYITVRHRAWLAGAMVCGLASIHSVTEFDTHGHYDITIMAFAVFALFSGSFLFRGLQEILSGRALVVMGLISYPLYLIHENMMVSMIIKLGVWAPWIPAIALPVLPIIVVIALGWMIASQVEDRLRAALKASYRRYRQIVTTRADSDHSGS